MNEQLHMHSLRLHQGRLFEFARRRHLPVHEVDLGYVVHCALGELFGQDAPQPFTIADDRGSHVKVLGYAAKPKDALAHNSAAFADPSIHAVCEWATHESKRMPDAWETGQRLGFEVRVLPVVRLARGATLRQAGAETDAFLAKTLAAGPDAKLDRQEVYRAWFLEHLARLGGAVTSDVCLTSFQRVKLVRRTQGDARASRLTEQPSASLAGTFEVTDPEAFQNLLGRGIGRHRAFGFGMLLLRRPG
jgi:CRISPR system Cascade subunit CasE